MRVLVLVALAGCYTPAALGTASVGYAHPTGGDVSSAGAQGGIALGIGRWSSGTGFHANLRRTGMSQQLAFGIHGFHVESSGPWHAFVRGGVNLLEWDRVGTDDGLGLLGPSFEVGVGVGGACVIASVERDFRFNDPDETFVAVSAALCGVHKSRRLRFPWPPDRRDR